MSKIMISELQETTSAPDSSYIAIDNGATTNKITIANYNTNANNLQTLKDLTIKYRGNVKLNINAYKDNNLQNCTYKNVEYICECP